MDEQPLLVAYADPPYIGCAHIYRDHPDYGGEVDHAELVERLCVDYPDGWALSAKSTSLTYLLSICPDDVRVLVWCKPFATWKKGVSPTYAWEPVIVRGGRKPDYFIHDWHASAPAMVKGFTEAKTTAFCHWLFACMGLLDGDTVHDMFPGTGSVSRSWDAYVRNPRIGVPMHVEKMDQASLTDGEAWPEGGRPS